MNFLKNKTIAKNCHNYCRLRIPLTRRPPRSGQEVRSIEDGSGSKVVGTVSSGNFSPELGVGIALAFLDTDIQPGDQVVIDQRGTDVPATVVKPPFLA